jgi:TRAP transporter 4TM/12TM fusion protein
MGPALPILGVILILYALFGQYAPGMFEHPGFLLERVVSQLYGNDGIFGTPVAVTVTYVFMFVLFGAFMDACGAGTVLMDLAMAIAGRSRGGAAKIAIIASSFFGSLNGSPVANVTATGTFTIPLMKRTHYEPAFAGAVEAAASTGGQILPPIMGAAVFIMMEILGEPYLAIATAAIIPALLYYVGVFWMVDLEARRQGLKGLPRDQVPRFVSVLRKGGYLLIPILILVYYLVIAQVSPLRAAMWGIVSCLIVSSFQAKSRFNLKKIVDALYTAMRGTVMVMAACAVAGMIVGILGLSGLGINMANIIIGYSGGYLPATLLLATFVTLIMGIGMPTTGSYIIGATIIAPALVQLGVLPLAAHLFVLYFANISNITPPVALAGYAAGGIAGANPLTVGVKAFKLGLAGVLVPYAWVYGPELILVGKTGSIIFSSCTAVVGILALGAAIMGFLGKRPLGAVTRILLAAAAIMLVIPEVLTDSIAVALIATALLLARIFPKSGLTGGLLDEEETTS